MFSTSGRPRSAKTSGSDPAPDAAGHGAARKAATSAPCSAKVPVERALSASARARGAVGLCLRIARGLPPR
eukprot:7292602-Alexandrium_andersonii.AAC.1